MKANTARGCIDVMPRSGEQRGLRVTTVAQCLCAAWKELPQSFILAAYIACGWLTVDEALAELDRMNVKYVTPERLKTTLSFPKHCQN